MKTFEQTTFNVQVGMNNIVGGKSEEITGKYRARISKSRESLMMLLASGLLS